MNAKILPNLLSATRIALMPAVLLTAMAGERGWFVGVLAAALLTDALDGFLARRLNAFSDFGRKLDSAADYLTMLTGIAGIALLWPDYVKRELPWIVTGLAAFFAVIVFGFVRIGRAPCYHTWLAKAGVVGCALSLIPLLSGGTAVWFHVMIIIEVIAAVEEMLITVVVPEHTGEMPTLWHALRQRRANQSLLGAGSRAPWRAKDSVG